MSMSSICSFCLSLLDDEPDGWELLLIVSTKAFLLKFAVRWLSEIALGCWYSTLASAVLAFWCWFKEVREPFSCSSCFKRFGISASKKKTAVKMKKNKKLVDHFSHTYVNVGLPNRWFSYCDWWNILRRYLFEIFPSRLAKALFSKHFRDYHWKNWADVDLATMFLSWCGLNKQ